jgi:RNA polymerase sigma-70 factor (ECF subfamily)
MAHQHVLQPWDEKALAALDAGQIDSALDALVQGYQQIVLAYCIATMGDAAIGEEVALDVFGSIWQALPGFRRESSFRTWIFAIARNTCIKRMGIRGRLRRIFVYGIDKTFVKAQPDLSGSPEEVMMKQQQGERLQHALEKLTRKDRDLITMVYFEGLSLEAIAKRRSQGRETVRQALLKAQQKLKQILDRYDHGIP